MPCFHPVKAFQLVTPSPNGKRPVIFSETEALKRPTTPLTLPCGKCVGCRLDRSKAWALRCMHESTLWDRSSFLTLTYAPQHLPPNGSLVKRDFQLFMKRLRKWKGDERVSYYMCGEYGDRDGRPHYHALLFGEDFCADRIEFKRSKGLPIYVSPKLSELWGLGHAWIGTVTFQSAAYVARYVMKKRLGEGSEKHYERIDADTGEIYTIEPEYNQMSLNPAIGRGWFDAYSSDVYPDDFCIIDGRKVRSPKYYDRLLEKAHPELLEKVKKARKAKARTMMANNTPERLAVRETCLEAKLSKLVREV